MTGRHLVVVSDLDGTLLDHETYRFDAALPALERLREMRAPVVLCTSKTRAELEPLRVSLGNTDPFIVENGGAVVVPRGYFPFEIERADHRGGMEVVPIGDAYPDLVAALARASEESGVAVRGFSDMTAEAIAGRTGLSLDGARRAKRREFDEPFEVLDGGPTGALTDAITRLGKRWTVGGRFYHITGASDKAAAVRVVVDLYHRQLGVVTIVGLGDAVNDVEFLREVDIPIVIRSPRADEVAGLVPGATITSRPGPSGWNEAILELLAGR